MTHRDTYDMFNRNTDRGRFGENECGNDSIRGNDSVRSNLCDIDVVIHHGTDKALLVSIDGNESRAQWLPKSRIEIDHKPGFVQGKRNNSQSVQLNIATITLPTSLAKEKGLV